MSINNDNIKNGLNCVSCTLYDFSQKQIAIATDEAVQCVSCCNLPLPNRSYYSKSRWDMFLNNSNSYYNRLFLVCGTKIYPTCVNGYNQFLAVDKEHAITIDCYNYTPVTKSYCMFMLGSYQRDLRVSSSTWTINGVEDEWVVFFKPGLCSGNPIAIGDAGNRLCYRLSGTSGIACTACVFGGSVCSSTNVGVYGIWPKAQ